MSWFAHGSDALYLGSILRHSDPCELIGQASVLLKKPLNLLILNRRDDRRLANIKEILSAVSIVAVQNSVTIQPLYTNATTSTTVQGSQQHHVNEFLFEGVSLREQAETMYSADIIITTHGAAETNLAWLKPCSIVIEIYGYPFFELYFKGLSEVLNLVHYWWQEPSERVIPASSPIGSTNCARERIIERIIDKVHNELYQEQVSSSNNPSNANVNTNLRRSQLHITTPNFGQIEYYSSNSNSNSIVDRTGTEVDSIVTQRCMHDSKCRSCSRGNKEISVTTSYLQSILTLALRDRQQCIQNHPFYTHTSTT